jgi:hypothetical protein
MNSNSLEENVSNKEVPRGKLRSILYYLLLQKTHREKHHHSPFPYYHKRHPHFLFQHHKNFQLVSLLKGSALCLLQTQYAKKPKNPV